MGVMCSFLMLKYPKSRGLCCVENNRSSESVSR